MERIVQNLVDNDEVRAVWVSGSIARGTADDYSDIDLRVAILPKAVEAWCTPDFETLFDSQVVGRIFLGFGAAFLHHLVLENGDIYDLWIQDTNHSIEQETNRILVCKDAELQERIEAANVPLAHPEEPAVTPETIRELIETFWIGSHKHRKVLHRGLWLLAHTGIEIERKILLRLHYILATGRDTSKQTPTIHSLTHLVRTVQKRSGNSVLQVLGTPMNTPNALFKTIETLRDEMTHIGQELALKFTFLYPHRLEKTVRDGWAQYRTREKRG